jgi:hypothetical protein
MMFRPTVILKTSPRSTRVLVSLGDDEVLKAVLPSPSTPPHARALPLLLEAMSLWHQTSVHAVLCAAEQASWSRLGLLDGLGLGRDTAHYTVELREPVRGRGQRIAGLGRFDDLRQLVIGGVR